MTRLCGVKRKKTFFHQPLILKYSGKKIFVGLKMKNRARRKVAGGVCDNRF